MHSSQKKLQGNVADTNAVHGDNNLVTHPHGEITKELQNHITNYNNAENNPGSQLLSRSTFGSLMVCLSTVSHPNLSYSSLINFSLRLCFVFISVFYCIISIIAHIFLYLSISILDIDHRSHQVLDIAGWFDEADNIGRVLVGHRRLIESAQADAG